MIFSSIRLNVPFILALTTAVFYVCIFFGFIPLDDHNYVTTNPYITSLNLWKIFNLKSQTLHDWTPLVTLSHAIEYSVWGISPHLSHAVNLILHLFAVYLVNKFLLEFGFSKNTANLTTLIFAIHPLQVETVVWVSSRKNIIALIFGLLFLISAKRQEIFKSIIFLILALAGKGTAVGFVAMFCLYWVFTKFYYREKVMNFFWLILFVFLAMLRVYISVDSQKVGIVYKHMGQLDVFERLAFIPPLIFKQLRQVILPYDLEMRYMWPLKLSWTSAEVLFPLIVLVTILGLSYFYISRSRLVLYAAIITISGFLPHLPILPSPELQADRFMYFTVVGLGAFIGLAFEAIPQVSFRKALYVIWISCLIPLSWARAIVFTDQEKFQQTLILDHPTWGTGWMGYIGILSVINADEEKVEIAKKSFQYLKGKDLEDTQRYYILGLLELGRIAEAKDFWNKKFTQEKESVDQLFLKAEIEIAESKLAEAKLTYDRIITLESKSPVHRYKRALIYRKLNDIISAKQDIKYLIEEFSYEKIINEMYAPEDPPDISKAEHCKNFKSALADLLDDQINNLIDNKMCLE